MVLYNMDREHFELLAATEEIDVLAQDPECLQVGFRDGPGAVVRHADHAQAVVANVADKREVKALLHLVGVGRAPVEGFPEKG